MIIYKIENKINGKIYIGKTKYSVNKRICEHICTNKFPIGKALNKYGLESFNVSIIDESQDKEIINEKEKYWIMLYNCISPFGYNLSKDGEGNDSPRSDEAKRKMSVSHKGMKFSDEHRAKLSARIRHPLSEETKRKIRETKLKRGTLKGKPWSEKRRLAIKGKPWTEKRRLAQIERGKRNGN